MRMQIESVFVERFQRAMHWIASFARAYRSLFVFKRDPQILDKTVIMYVLYDRFIWSLFGGLVCFSATLDLTLLSSDISRTCVETSSSAPQLKCTHNTHNIRWSELKQAKLSSLSSHLLAVFVAFMWNKERVNRAKAQSYTAAEH